MKNHRRDSLRFEIWRAVGVARFDFCDSAIVAFCDSAIVALSSDMGSCARFIMLGRLCGVNSNSSSEFHNYRIYLTSIVL